MSNTALTAGYLDGLRGIDPGADYNVTRTTGRTYKVKIHDFYPMAPAYEYHGEFKRPEPAKVIWPGTGGYWSEAAVADIRVG